MNIIGVMGPGKDQATADDLLLAKNIGALVASLGCATLTGGMRGVMEAAATGAQEAGGLTIGIGPTLDKNDLNDAIDVKLATGMHAGRNYMNILSSDVLVFVSVRSPGTLSELAHAIQAEKPSLVIHASEHLQQYVAELGAPTVTFCTSLEMVKTNLVSTLQTLNA